MLNLAKRNIEQFRNDSELAEYIAFLFSELARLDSEWKENLESEIKEMESE